MFILKQLWRSFVWNAVVKSTFHLYFSAFMCTFGIVCWE